MVRLIRVFDVQDSIPYPFKFFFSLAGLVSSLSLFVHRRPSDFFYVLDMSVLYGGTRLNFQEQFYYYTFTQCRVVDPLD